MHPRAPSPPMQTLDSPGAGGGGSSLLLHARQLEAPHLSRGHQSLSLRENL